MTVLSRVQETSTIEEIVQRVGALLGHVHRYTGHILSVICRSIVSRLKTVFQVLPQARSVLQIIEDLRARLDYRHSPACTIDFRLDSLLDQVHQHAPEL